MTAYRSLPPDQREHGLEVSPIEADGSQKIGRDPRKLTQKFLSENLGHYGGPLTQIIRERCLDCCANQETEVRKCTSVGCPSWPYRMGTNPFRTRTLTDEQRAAAADRLRAHRQNRQKVE